MQPVKVLEFTSLMDEEEKKLMKRLAEQLAAGNAIHPNTKDTVVEVWQRFDALYAVVNHDYRDQNGVTSANVWSSQ